ncbi:MAG TPA: triose-phosphate isomerase [Candidatus Saccharimonadia bacterium]|nr:triose-phosphate isomerase [Candidatus Saccharimonadia bacterium]
MKRLIVANWKMNLGPGEASLLMRRLDEHIEAKSSTEIVICPPAIDLYPLAKDLDRKKFKLGAQNVHYLDSGPYTGEISPAMLAGLADYVIVGHSERRAMGEDDSLIAAKLSAAVRNNLTPVLCIGENLHDHQHNLAERVVVDQLTAALANLTADDIAGLVIAYEPVWAINHHDGHPPRPATPDDIRFAYRAIRTTLEELYGEGGLAGVRLLYGGSVDPDHCRAYLEMDHVDGLLPGTSSLNYESFAKIVKTVQSL